MKILLVGEYSGLHNSLKEGLIVSGHHVTLISTGDYFKNYPSDIKLKRKFETGLGKKLKVLCYKVFGIDITSISLKKQFLKHREKLQDYDVVQLINESPLGGSPKLEQDIIGYLHQHNHKLFLLSCGTDFLSVQYALSDAPRYSILKEYKDGNVSAQKFDFALKYTRKPFKELHEYVYSKIRGVIASDIDYHLPLKDHPKYLGLVPNPVNMGKLSAEELEADGPIRIFLGINRTNYDSKGIVYFKKALEIIESKYTDKVLIETVENLPYSEYISKYDKAHIVLDQVLGYDQGYNALEAMAKGKVVFTGSEKEFSEYYQLQEAVAINAVPNVEQIVVQLEDLILNPSKIKLIGASARAFVKREHDHLKVAQKYLDIWQGH